MIKLFIEKFKGYRLLEKDFIFFSLLSIVGSVFSSFSPLIVAKILNPGLFGSYSLGMAIIFLFFTVFISSSQAPCIILANKEIKKTGKANKTFTVLFYITIVMIILAAIIFLTFSNQIQNFTNIYSPYLAVSFLAAFIGYSIKSLFQTILLGFDKKKLSAILEICFGLFSFLILLLLYYFKIQYVQLIISIYFPIGIILFLISIFTINKELIFPFKYDFETLKTIFHFVKWQILGLIAIYFVNWGDNFVLRLYVKTDQIGLYNLSYKFFSGFITMIYFVNTYFLPILSRNTGNNLYISDYLNIKRPKIFFVILTCIISSIVIVPITIKLMYGDLFIKSTSIYLILSLALISFAYTIFYIPFFNTIGKYKIIQIASIIQIIVNIGLDFVLIPYIGIYGSAIATVCGYFVLLTIYNMYYKKIM